MSTQENAQANGHAPQQEPSRTPVLIEGGMAPGDDGKPWPVLILTQGNIRMAMRLDERAAEQIGPLVTEVMTQTIRQCHLTGGGLILPGQEGFAPGTPRTPPGMPPSQ